MKHPELKLRYIEDYGYQILLVGTDRYVGIDVLEEELCNAEQFIDPLLSAIEHLHLKYHHPTETKVASNES